MEHGPVGSTLFLVLQPECLQAAVVAVEILERQGQCVACLCVHRGILQRKRHGR